MNMDMHGQELMEKVLNGTYHVLMSETLNGNTVILAEYLKAENRDEVYLCLYTEERDGECNAEIETSEYYAPVLKSYAEHLLEMAKERKSALVRLELFYQTIRPFRKEDVTPITRDMDLTDRMVVMNETCLDPAYRTNLLQLFICTGGYGAGANAQGIVCKCISLYNGKDVEVNRSDLIGVLPLDKAPEWVLDNCLINVEDYLERSEKENDRV